MEIQLGNKMTVRFINSLKEIESCLTDAFVETGTAENPPGLHVYSTSTGFREKWIVAFQPLSSALIVEAEGLAKAQARDDKAETTHKTAGSAGA